MEMDATCGNAASRKLAQSSSHRLLHQRALQPQPARGSTRTGTASTQEDENERGIGDRSDDLDLPSGPYRVK